MSGDLRERLAALADEWESCWGCQDEALRDCPRHGSGDCRHMAEGVVKQLRALLADAPTPAQPAAPQGGDVEALVLHIPRDRVRQDKADADADLNVGTDHIDVPVVIDPDLPERGKYDYAFDGSRVIRMREWNEQVLLHELLHAALDHVLPRTVDDPHGHDVIARAEVALWETGWRLRHDADLRASAARETAERIAAAIEAEASKYPRSRGMGLPTAARIARAEGDR